MKNWRSYLVAFAWFIGALSSVPAETPADPVEYCKAHPTEAKCVVFLGGKSPYYSGYGNVGGSSGTPSINRYIVFLHDGGGPPDLSRKVADALRAKGYEVRGPDHDVDDAGGTGV